MLDKTALNSNVDASAIRQIKENSTWYMMLGIALVVLGSFALIFSLITTFVSVLYLGAFIVVLGAFEAFHSFKVSKWSGFFLHLFISILYIVGGIFIVFNPTLSALSLTLFLAIFFVVTGIMRIIFSFDKNVPHRFWLLFNGIVTLILGILIWRQWPISGLWVIGMLVAIEAIFTGWTWIMLSMAAKSHRYEVK